MLDTNGNDRLDDGTEVFGNFTPLANGAMPSNGFQVLAQYDSNDDGKIDATDTIWSELKVWRYESGLCTDT
ncbi:hypothetical protein ACFL2Q_10745 [Thermodesulfobacteriota bacterium]